MIFASFALIFKLSSYLCIPNLLKINQCTNNMKELSLKYGCNPNQKPSRIFMTEGELPVEIINGRPGYINFLDALNSWQLVKELKEATGMPAAASFKHVSPAGAAVGLPLSDTLKKIYFVDDVKIPLSPLACAYARARGADRMSSYGDFVALSDICDEATAALIKREVSDGVIAPGYTPEAIEILKEKRKGSYNVIKIDPSYRPAAIERKQVFGVTFEQGRNEVKLNDPALFENIPTKNKSFPENAMRDLIISLITLKYTQSNSVCYVKDGQAIGIGAGQQSRIHCTRLAGNKADIWWLRQCPKVMNLPFKPGIRRADRDNTIDVYIGEEHDDVLREGTWQLFFTEKPDVLTAEEKKEWIAKNSGVALGSDAFFPFGDNIERAHKSGVEFIAQAGGSVRDDHVIDTCDKYGIAMAFTGVRLFHH
jgi:phosphoribosylaminoimidazolecarboxamide formyltransferase/IMP cyclohydrolase